VTEKRPRRKLIAGRKLVTLPDKYVPDFLERMNLNHLLGRTISRRIDEIETDRGGPEVLSYVQRSNIKRFVWMEALVEHGEQRMAAGESIELGAHVQAVNTYMALGVRIGLERKPRNVRRLADVMQGRPAA
jgi:predicted NUDIX family phosphoesterase